ncbi:hypothetical protein BaRGS_00035814 [Batillaria attramentaria]|uniref:Uncharacterized protein n=1 Tax=Batillaria attramentaria TaxID=370345 RepID=A0ABD0JDP2_9CAEN
MQSASDRPESAGSSTVLRGHLHGAIYLMQTLQCLAVFKSPSVDSKCSPGADSHWNVKAVINKQEPVTSYQPCPHSELTASCVITEPTPARYGLR